MVMTFKSIGVKSCKSQDGLVTTTRDETAVRRQAVCRNLKNKTTKKGGEFFVDGQENCGRDFDYYQVLVLYRTQSSAPQFAANALRYAPAKFGCK